MKEVDKERAWWDAAGVNRNVAVDKIAAGPESWREGLNGPLDRELEKIGHAFAPALQGRDRPKYVLDLGCGIGRVLLPLARAHPWIQFYGVDISQKMLDLADEDSRQFQNIRWMLGDGRALPALPKLDAAYSLLMFQHIPRDAAASYINQIAERLNIEGRLFFQTLEGTGGGFLWNEVTEEFVHTSCGNAGLRVVSIERTRPNTGDDVNVLWVTAEKI